MRLGVAMAASGIVACRAVPAAPSLRADPSDEAERRSLRAASPVGADLLARGEALFASGSIEQAEKLFQEGLAANADGALLWRRDCEALTRLGERKRAILACAEAIERRRSPRAVTQLVSALVDGPQPPTPTQLVEALMIAAKERENPVGERTAAAASCDIAGRIGDTAMLERCEEEMERLAPGEPETEAARQALASRCPPWRFWGGWSAIFLAVACTLGDIVRRALRSRRAFAAAMSCVVASSLLAAPSARADESSPEKASLGRWPVDPDHPEASVPSESERNAEPLAFGYWIQEIALRGERASDAGDHAAAARFYSALAIAVPDRAVGFVKACHEYEALGDLDRAVNACGDALLREGAVVGDYSRFVTLVLSKPGRLGVKETAALGQVLIHMREDPAGRATVDELECQVGARTLNVAQLAECTQVLAQRAPEDGKTITYQWALAVARADIPAARRFRERAIGAGVAPESVRAMEQATEELERAARWRLGLGTVAAALFLAALLTIAMVWARQRAGIPASQLAQA